MRRPTLLLLLTAVGALLARRRARASQSERALWTEATAPPDLR